VVVAEPVGAAGQRGFLRQHRQPGQQRGGRVGEQVTDVGDPPGAGELERQQGQQPADRGDDPGAGVAGRGGQGGQVQVHQIRDDEQQPGPDRLQPGRPGSEVDHLGARQAGVPAGCGRADAGLGLGAADQPSESFPGQDLPDRRAVQRPALGCQPRRDLVGGQPLPAQLDHPAACPVLRRRRTGRRAGLLGMTSVPHHQRSCQPISRRRKVCTGAEGDRSRRAETPPRTGVSVRHGMRG
jgi:hypothetical protein